MSAGSPTQCELALATLDDIPGIVDLQEPNLRENGGGLSARQTAEWFKDTMQEMPIIVAGRVPSHGVGGR